MQEINIEERIVSLVDAINRNSKYSDEESQEIISGGITCEGRLLLLLRNLIEAMMKKNSMDIHNNKGAILNLSYGLLPIIRNEGINLEYSSSENVISGTDSSGDRYFQIRHNYMQREEVYFFYENSTYEVSAEVVEGQQNKFECATRQIKGKVNNYSVSFKENGLLHECRLFRQIDTSFTDSYSLMFRRTVSYTPEGFSISDGLENWGDNLPECDRNDAYNYKNYTEGMICPLLGFTVDFRGKSKPFVSEESISFAFPELYEVAINNVNITKGQTK